MRSELVGGALKHVPNRYLMARLVAKAIRAFHRPNSRVAETANEVLLRFSLSDPMARRPKLSSPKNIGLRRAIESRTRRSPGWALSNWHTTSTGL